jgi:hypothetical protein
MKYEVLSDSPGSRVMTLTNERPPGQGSAATRWLIPQPSPDKATVMIARLKKASENLCRQVSQAIAGQNRGTECSLKVIHSAPFLSCLA